MRIALIYPPTCDPITPYIALPTLTAFLRHHGVAVLQIDASLEAYDRLLRPSYLAEMAKRATARLWRLIYEDKAVSPQRYRQLARRCPVELAAESKLRVA
jgi:hypothetical protein